MVFSICVDNVYKKSTMIRPKFALDGTYLSSKSTSMVDSRQSLKRASALVVSRREWLQGHGGVLWRIPNQ